MIELGISTDVVVRPDRWIYYKVEDSRGVEFWMKIEEVSGRIVTEKEVEQFGRYIKVEEKKIGERYSFPIQMEENGRVMPNPFYVELDNGGVTPV